MKKDEVSLRAPMAEILYGLVDSLQTSVDHRLSRGKSLYNVSFCRVALNVQDGFDIYILFICIFCIHLSLLHYKKMLKIKYSEASLNVDTTNRLRSFGASNSVESLNKCFDRLKERKLNHFVEFIAQLAHLEATYPHSDELL